MLMTRFVYLCATVLLVGLNGAALWAVSRSGLTDTIVPATLVMNLICWPLALIVAYRVGQVTGQEYFRKVKTRLAAAHKLRHAK